MRCSLAVWLGFFFRKACDAEIHPARMNVNKQTSAVFKLNPNLVRSMPPNFLDGSASQHPRRLPRFRSEFFLRFRYRLGFWNLHLSVPNASDQQRPASGQTELLKYGAMWSGNIIDDLGEIKGVRCG